MNISIAASLPSNKAETLLAEIRKLAPAIGARVTEIEARRLPACLRPATELRNRKAVPGTEFLLA